MFKRKKWSSVSAGFVPSVAAALSCVFALIISILCSSDFRTFCVCNSYSLLSSFFRASCLVRRGDHTSKFSLLQIHDSGNVNAVLALLHQNLARPMGIIHQHAA